jgi:hypothetical protein
MVNLMLSSSSFLLGYVLHISAMFLISSHHPAPSRALSPYRKAKARSLNQHSTPQNSQQHCICHTHSSHPTGNSSEQMILTFLLLLCNL